MIGILFATHTEARPFLTLSQAVLLHNVPIAVYQIPSIHSLLVAVSGMGKVWAAVASQTLIREHRVSEIINAGACGALQDGPRFQPGRLFCIASAVEGDHWVTGKSPRPLISDGKMEWDLPAARLVTTDQPVFDLEKRRKLAAFSDLVDMEGAAIARVAAMYQAPWTMVKGITDSAGPLDRDSLLKNLKQISETIGQLLWSHLSEI